MRILHLSALYPPNLLGGAERLVAVLAQEQARSGHHVGVVTLARQSEPAREENGVLVHRIGHASLYWWYEDRSKHAPVRYINKLLESWNPITVRHVRDVIESFRPDVVNSHSMAGFSVSSWKAAAEREIPIVHTLHDFNLFCAKANAFRNGRMCDGICLACRIMEPKRRLSRLTSGVVGVSRDVLQRHLDRGFFGHIPPGQRSVIWNPPSVSGKDHSVGSSRSSETAFTIGYIGRIVPEKGISILLDAVAGLPPQGWRLLVAGNILRPLDPSALRAQAAGLPVDWLGVVPAADFFSQIDILVVPSIWAEPCPLVVVEAFAFGVPVIGSRIGGITELIEEGVTGWHSEPGDVAALRAILTERIRIGRSALPKAAAFARIQHETTLQHVADQYENLYRCVGA
jgi:glycosyltransferase involved in cell wall biosynthesis